MVNLIVTVLIILWIAGTILLGISIGHPIITFIASLIIFFASFKINETFGVIVFLAVPAIIIIVFVSLIIGKSKNKKRQKLINKSKLEKFTFAKQEAEKNQVKYSKYISSYEFYLDCWEKEALSRQSKSILPELESFSDFVIGKEKEEEKRRLKEKQNRKDVEEQKRKEAEEKRRQEEKTKLYKTSTYEKYEELYDKCFLFDKYLTKLSKFSWKQLQEAKDSNYFEKYLSYLCNEEKKFQINCPNCVKCKKINSEDFYTYTDNNERLCCSNCEFKDYRIPWTFKTWDLIRKDDEEREQKIRMERVMCPQCGGNGKSLYDNYALQTHKVFEDSFGIKLDAPFESKGPCDLCHGTGTCFRYQSDEYIADILKRT